MKTSIKKLETTIHLLNKVIDAYDDFVKENEGFTEYQKAYVKSVRECRSVLEQMISDKGYLIF
jgi:lysozyme family protein